MNMICSIVRIVQPGAKCSHPVGKREVYFLAPYQPCLHVVATSRDHSLTMRGRSWDQNRVEARRLCETFNNCRGGDDLGFWYEVEEIDADFDERAPE